MKEEKIKLIEALEEWIKEKKYFFVQATGGNTDSSIYSKAVVQCLEDVSAHLEEIKKEI